MTSSPHRYRETRPLAHGGMATLVLAEREDAEVVVVKRVRPPFDHDPVYRGLFLDEGELCARLSSEHIVRLLDRGTDELGPFLVFEYLRGTDLGVVLEARLGEQRGLELAAFFALALPLASALSSAHETVGPDGEPLGLVHRDVSPGNVLLSLDGEVKLADFGVALSRLKTEHTVAGELKGKFAYMAPEQTRTGDVDARADVFAAGVLFWEALRGQRLFDGPTDADVVHAVREQAAPRLEDTCPEVTPALASLVAAMLSKDPAGRPETMREVHEALAEQAAALGLDRGQRSSVARLARAYPRPDVEEHAHVSELRRRTQRVLNAAPAASAPPARDLRARRLGVFVVIGAVVVAGVALALLSPREPPPAAPPLALAPAPTPTTTTAPTPTTTTAPATTTTTAATTAATPPPPARAKPPADEATPKRAPRHERPAARAPAATGFGTLVLESEPWANVSVGGEPLGQHTPLIGLRLPAGRHRLTLENPVYRLTRDVDVVIRPEAETRRFVDLTKR